MGVHFTDQDQHLLHFRKMLRCALTRWIRTGSHWPSVKPAPFGFMKYSWTMNHFMHGNDETLQRQKMQMQGGAEARLCANRDWLVWKQRLEAEPGCKSRLQHAVTAWQAAGLAAACPALCASPRARLAPHTERFALCSVGLRDSMARAPEASRATPKWQCHQPCLKNNGNCQQLIKPL